MPQNPADILGQFFSPALELAKLRNSRRDELDDFLANNPRDLRTHVISGQLERDMAEDPFTGAEPLARQKFAEDALTKAGVADLEPIASQRRHQEAVGLQKSMVEHPSPNVSPFANAGGIPNVPGGVPTGRPSSSPMLAGGGHGVPPPPGIDPERWAQHTADLTPDSASKLAAVLQYDQGAPAGNVLARPEWSTIMGRTKQVDPNFDAKQYDARKGYLTQFAKSDIPVSLDTLMHHLDSFAQAGQGLHNTGIKPWNWLTNEMTSATVGNPALSKFEQAKDAVAGELANVFKKTGATDAEIKTWTDNLSSSATPDELKGKLGELTNLIRGRMDAVSNRYQSVMGRQSPQLLSDESRGIWQKYNQAEQTGGGGIQPGTEGVINGVPAVWDGHGWLRK